MFGSKWIFGLNKIACLVGSWERTAGSQVLIGVFPLMVLSSAYNLLSNGAKGMMLYAQESLRLVRSLAREVLNHRHLLNIDFSSWP